MKSGAFRLPADAGCGYSIRGWELFPPGRRTRSLLLPTVLGAAVPSAPPTPPPGSLDWCCHPALAPRPRTFARPPAPGPAGAIRGTRRPGPGRGGDAVGKKLYVGNL